MKNNVRLKVGQKIKELRQKKGLTQEQLAESTGIDYKYLQKIEGKTPPNLKVETIEKIAHSLKIPCSKLLDFD